MSSNVTSPIFNSLIKYFSQANIKSIKTIAPVDNADLYYYFRPHLEIKLRSPCVVTVHHDLLETGDSLSISKFIPRYLEANLIICLNRAQQDILQTYNITNTTIIPHGYNSDIFFFKHKIQRNKKTIGFISHFYPRLVKGEKHLANIAAHLPVSDYKFILVGRHRKKLANQLIENGFEIEVYEHLPYWLFGKLYQRLSCLLITSMFEGGPASLPEALASNTPIFSMPVGMVNDYKGSNLITILTGSSKDDARLIKDMKTRISYDPSSLGLLTYKEVAEKYFNIFSLYACQQKTSKTNDMLRVFYFQCHYLYDTLYLKKKLKSYFFNIFDTVKFLYLSRF
jgi:glycosyltransferase involved in cell wall biosynthesis